MGGILLTALVDAFLGTSQAVLSGENFILNEKQRRNLLLSMVMKGNDMEDMIKGGDTITDQLILEEDRTYGPYNVLEQKTPRLSNHLTEYTINWAFTDAHVTFDKHEKGINQMSSLNSGARAMVFKNIIRAKWSNLYVDINNGMEREFFAQPSNATMETVTSGTRVPYSIFASITEIGATAASPTGTVPYGFTTVQGINPTTFTEWRNPVEYYGATALTTAGVVSWAGFTAFSRMYQRMRFEELAIRPEFGEASTPDGFIMCSLNGVSLMEEAQRKANDWTRHGASNGGYPGINYNGVPVKWVESMDHANVWDDAAQTGFAGENNNTVDEDGVATSDPLFEGPRFVWIVPKYFRKYIHADHFLEEERPPASVNQPYQQTVFFDCWHNNGTRSRRRAGGVVSPSADITGYISA